MLLDPYNKRLNNFEKEQISNFDFDFNFYQNPVKVSKILSVNNVICHSKEYNRVGKKRCDYAIKYIGKNDLFEFGMIKYFIKINDKVP